ncbi:MULTISPECIES: DNA cytosine methyltransferase [Pseudomonas]|jgi:DNA (cytosine-5)-methyltransferase 1|uniref:DNA cytosine methyltransferase n=1 Tax=Pseudomonas TaxID=286 RepID=UPI000357D0A1|nr:MULTISPECIES: DNA cytosine methyltransferase [Pseudomonas]EPJ82397.1 C-5 cytosine-specific DNA methylase [Pseudomonas sp. CFT9]OKP74654.1 DNA cytosine methyltransferase [Pseudomonas fluorescens]
MNELALFAGAGGGILGGQLLGRRTVCAVERDAYAAQILAQRQTDGLLPPFPIWSDVCSFDGRPWRGLVDVVSGGFPCQDISAAGNGLGIDGARSGLWRQMARITDEVRPRYLELENSPLLVGRGLAVVLGDLAEMGYDAQWGVIGAADFAAPHQRNRIWLIAEDSTQALANAGGEHGQGVLSCRIDPPIRGKPHKRSTGSCGDGIGWWSSEPGLGRVADGVAYRLDRLKAIGNG